MIKKQDKYKKNSESFRRFSKKVFLKDPEKNSTHLVFAGILFAIYGCYQNLNTKFRDQFPSTFLNTNLPIFQTASQRLHWETLTEIGIRDIVTDSTYNNFFSAPLSNPFVESFVLDNAAKTVGICFYSPWSQLKKQEFVALFPVKVGTYLHWSVLSAREIPDKSNIVFKKNLFSYPLFNSKGEKLSLFETFQKDTKNQIVFWYSDDIPVKFESFSTTKRRKRKYFLKKNKKRTKAQGTCLMEKKTEAQGTYSQPFGGELQRVVSFERSLQQISMKALPDKIGNAQNLNSYSNVWRGILSKSFPNWSQSPDLKNLPSQKKFPKGQEVLLKGGKTLFPSRLVSGFLWPDMTKSEIWSNFDMFGIKGIRSSPISALLERVKMEGFEIGIKKISIESIVNQLLLRQMRTSLPANIASKGCQGEGDFHSPSFLLNYKKGELPVLKYVRALANDLKLEVDQSTIERLKKRFYQKEKKKMLLKRAFSALNVWKRKQTDKKVISRSGKYPETYLGSKDFSYAREWLQRMKGILATQQDSFFGEEKVLMVETPVEKEEFEFPTDLLREFEGDVFPFGGFAEKDFQGRLEEIEFFSSRKRKPNSYYFREFIEPSPPLLSIFYKRFIPELNNYEWYKFLQSQLEFYFTDRENLQFDSQQKGLNLAQNFKLRLPRIVIEKSKSSEISASLNLFNSQPFSLEVFPFFSKEIAFHSETGLDREANPLEYRFDFEPWSGDSFAELQNILPLIPGDYRKKSTNFEFLKNNKTNRFKNSQSFEQKWEPLTISSWRIFYKLFYILWIQESLKTLYKDYGKEILQSVISIFAALGFDVNQVLDFLNLRETESGLRVFEKTRRNFDDIAGVDSLLPELGETVWFLKSKGNLPFFQTSHKWMSVLKPEDWKILKGNTGALRNKEKEIFFQFWGLKSLRKSPLPFLPKGTLLVGPPGTGKTFLVQAVAGEAGVPVVVQSASTLMELNSNPSEALTKLFQKARDFAPCILFIDEVDTLGSSRENVLSDNTIFSSEPSLEIFSPKQYSLKEKRAPSLLPSWEKGKDLRKGLQGENYEETEEEKPSEGAPTRVLQYYQKEASTSKQKLAILMQFIVELDGLKELSGVALIGATNRPGVLDPALVRPGRFEKTLTLELPNKEKRIVIFQHYAKKIRLKTSLQWIQWNGLGEMTPGFTAGHISSAMNLSALHAAFKNHDLTLDTLEAGIKSVEREQKQSPSIRNKDINEFNPVSFLSKQGEFKYLQSFSNKENEKRKELDQEIEKLWKSINVTLSRVEKITNNLIPKKIEQSSIASLAYSESGKAVFHDFQFWFISLLHPEKERIHFYQNSFSRRFEAEFHLLQFHARKASKAFLIGTREADTKQKFYFLSNVSSEIEIERKDIFASSWGFLSQVPLLSEVAIQNDLLFSEDISLKNLFFLARKRDQSEIKDPLLRSSLKYLSLRDTEHIKRDLNYIPDYFLIRSYPSAKSYSELGDIHFGNWYRIYLSDPEQAERNEEWVKPDKIYSSFETLQNLVLAKGKKVFKSFQTKKNLLEPIGLATQKDIQIFIQDYIYQGLALNAFNQSHNLLNNNRELVDFTVHLSLRYQKIRSYEIKPILKNFLKMSSTESQWLAREKNERFIPKESISSSWGFFSQKPSPRLIQLDKI